MRPFLTVYCALVALTTYGLVTAPKTLAIQRQLTAHTISGIITDAESGETIIGAAIYVPVLQIGTTTNQYGFFSLTVETDTITLVISHLAFEPQTISRQLSSDLRLDLTLEPATLQIEGVEVVAVATGESPVQQTQMSRVDLPIKQIETLPALLGEIDVLKVIQLLPGVQSGQEGTTGLYVRGGGPDQNMFLLDGTQIYNPSHLFGFLSVFNGEAIKDVTLLKGGFPARYGGRLSSVVDITMKEGNLKQHTGMAAIGLLSSRFTVEGPIRKDKASFLIAARRSYADILARPFMNEDEVFGYYFYDINAKTNIILSPRNRLYLSGYAGHDRAFFEYESDYSQDNQPIDTSSEEILRSQQDESLGWRNLVSTLRWNHIFSPHLFANTVVGYTRYRLQARVKLVDTYYNYESSYITGIRDFHARTDFEFISGGNHYIRFGAGGIQHDFLTGALTERYKLQNEPAADTVYTPNRITSATELHLYAEDEMRLSPSAKINAGIHTSGFLVEGEQYFSVQPRVSLWLGVGPNSSIKASLVTMYQYIHLLVTARGISLPTDLWVPATKRIKPQHAVQAALGYAHSLQQGRFELAVEGFYKRMNNLIEYEEGASYINAAFSSWQDKVVSGKGSSYGAEVFLQKKAGRTTGWVGYTLSWTQREFPDLNSGKTFPYRYDRRHDISVVATHRLRPSIEISAAWVYGTGQAITLPIGQEVTLESQYYLLPLTNPDSRTYTQIMSDRNAVRMPAYHRLDIAAHFHKTLSWAEQKISIGAYNTYNRRNAFTLFAEQNPSTNDLEFKKISIIPVVPSITYQLTF